MIEPFARSVRSRRAVLGAWLLAGLLAASPAVPQDAPFDHFRSRFPLVGAHERVDCERCHAGGIFRGTPTRCVACHDGSGVRADTARDFSHIRTTADCDSCHLLSAWSPSRVDHDSVLGDCVLCHDGRTASGRSPSHPPSNHLCEACHGTVTWASARFDHTGITGGCVRCHDGLGATGKPPSHPPSSNLCEDCHTTYSWASARFDHTGIASGCLSCHNGSDATGKSLDHIRTTNLCESCHRPGSWLWITMDHAEAIGACSSCHDGANATGTPPGHFQSSQPCDLCHRTQAWLPDIFRHLSPAYPGDHGGPLACQACHTANTEALAWPFPAHQPACAACHQSDYAPGSHKKVDSPQILYTVSELRDCTGACHLYSDATFTTIQQSRTGEHRVGDPGW